MKNQTKSYRLQAENGCYSVVLSRIKGVAGHCREFSKDIIDLITSSRTVDFKRMGIQFRERNFRKKITNY